MEDSDSKQFGRYEIVGELGRGAMGVVYKARDPQIDRVVALKTVPLRGQEPEEEQEYRRRFLNEAQAAGRLHHPGIVAVFDVGESSKSNDPYIVLEYVAGEALNRMLAREKKLPLTTALQFVVEIAEALDYAHAQGVVHRDVKPGNIIVTQDGHPKIADFGIAKLNLAHFTVPGKVLGTPAYMAPEQLAGEGVDGRSDLFSLGVILYAMVVGHSPFQGNSATTVCFKVANREPLPASALDLNLPPELDAVIARAMAKDPKQRYQRGAEFAEDVRRLQAQRQPGSTTTSYSVTGATGTRTTAKREGLNGPPPVESSYAKKFIRAEILKSPIRDLILGVATIILLVVVGIQSNLLFSKREEAANPGPPHPQPSSAGSTRARGDQPRVDSARVQQSQLPQVPPDAEAPVIPKPVAPSPVAPAATPAPVRKTPLQAKAQPKKIPASVQPAKQVVVSLSSVELVVRHQFKEATLSVWVDDSLALTRPLHGGTQKRLVVFNGVRGTESETLKVPAGKHTLRFQAQTGDHMLDLSKTITGDFIGGDDRTLQISFDKHNTSMHLEWQ
jgi:eukaryotic-like serine/threonine-protein kinase